MTETSIYPALGRRSVRVCIELYSDTLDDEFSILLHDPSTASFTSAHDPCARVGRLVILPLLSRVCPYGGVVCWISAGFEASGVKMNPRKRSVFSWLLRVLYIIVLGPPE
jgi:hypothetical protein